MQITLIQAEIEAALEAYVNNLINIKEGHTIKITLKATRGEEGTTALVDIVPNGAEEVIQEQAAPAPAPARRLAIKKSEKPETEPEKTEQVQESQDASNVEQETVQEVATGEDTKSEQVAEEKPAETAPRASLFANLRKPTNS